MCSIIFDTDTKTLHLVTTIKGKLLRAQYTNNTKTYRDEFWYGYINKTHTKNEILQKLQIGLCNYAFYLHSLNIVNKSQKLSDLQMKSALQYTLDLWFSHDYHTNKKFDHKFNVECPKDELLLNGIVDIALKCYTSTLAKNSR